MLVCTCNTKFSVTGFCSYENTTSVHSSMVADSWVGEQLVEDSLFSFHCIFARQNYTCCERTGTHKDGLHSGCCSTSQTARTSLMISSYNVLILHAGLSMMMQSSINCFFKLCRCTSSWIYHVCAVFFTAR